MVPSPGGRPRKSTAGKTHWREAHAELTSVLPRLHTLRAKRGSRPSRSRRHSRCSHSHSWHVITCQTPLEGGKTFMEAPPPSPPLLSSLSIRANFSLFLRLHCLNNGLDRGGRRGKRGVWKGVQPISLMAKAGAAATPN